MSFWWNFIRLFMENYLLMFFWYEFNVFYRNFICSVSNCKKISIFHWFHFNIVFICSRLCLFSWHKKTKKKDLKESNEYCCCCYKGVYLRNTVEHRISWLHYSYELRELLFYRDHELFEQNKLDKIFEQLDIPKKINISPIHNVQNTL